MATQSDSSVAARLAPIASRSLILSAVIDPAATGTGCLEWVRSLIQTLTCLARREDAGRVVC